MTEHNSCTRPFVFHQFLIQWINWYLLRKSHISEYWKILFDYYHFVKWFGCVWIHERTFDLLFYSLFRNWAFIPITCFACFVQTLMIYAVCIVHRTELEWRTHLKQFRWTNFNVIIFSFHFYRSKETFSVICFFS